MLGVPQRRRPRVAAEHELEPHAEALHLRDPGDHADGVEAVGRRILGRVPLRDREDVLVRALCTQGRLHGPQRLEPARGDRRRHRREQHRVPQRDHGEREAFGHVPARLRDACHGAARTRRADPAVQRRHDGAPRHPREQEVVSRGPVARPPRIPPAASAHDVARSGIERKGARTQRRKKARRRECLSPSSPFCVSAPLRPCVEIRSGGGGAFGPHHHNESTTA